MLPKSSAVVEQKLQADFERAFLVHQQGNLAQARLGYQQILSVDPCYAPALNFMGVLHLQSGDTEEAIVLMRRAVLHAPDDLDFRVHLAAALIKKRYFKEAVELCNSVIARKPDYVSALYNLGDAFTQLAHYESALAVYDKALLIQPKSTSLWLSRGNVFRFLRQFRAAEECFSNALNLDPNFFEARLNRGNVRLELDMWDEAVEDYRFALQLRPDSDGVLTNLGNAYASRGQWLDALAYFNHANSDIARAEKLRCLYELGRYENFFDQVKRDQFLDQFNVRSASVVAFVAHQLNRKNEHLFCPEPMSFLTIGHMSTYETEFQAFIDRLLIDLLAIQSVWNPLNQATQSGYQTPASLFILPEGNLAQLEQIIRDEIESFKDRFKCSSCQMIRAWPEQFFLDGWFVNLKKNGFQAAHIHPQAWISGVAYLRVVPALSENEGAIEFGLHGNDLTVLDPDYPKRVHVPSAGELVLFPSCLFHRTIPFSADEERMVVAFDVIPKR